MSNLLKQDLYSHLFFRHLCQNEIRFKKLILLSQAILNDWKVRTRYILPIFWVFEVKSAASVPFGALVAVGWDAALVFE